MPYSENQILAAMTPADFEALSPHLRRVSLRNREVLYEPGDLVDRVYFPESCLVALVSPMASGKDVPHTLRGSDGGIGYVEALNSGEMFCRAVVRISGSARCAPASVVRQRYNASAAFRADINRRVEILLADARQSMACHAAHTPTGRLARLLLECAHHTGRRRFQLTQELIAELTGVGRTTISHCISELRTRGLIDCRRGELTLKDIDALRACACECYETLRRVRESVLGHSADERPGVTHNAPLARFRGRQAERAVHA
jgi:CRP-like cAMP-binding protein